ncbi:hypothetical protein OSB04_007376 [Centaurea solstitialis]|uniref:Uncharacterized protein n=1 Tax=Centaurea solstitialis TaxID=347529 RepID=A0AA38TXJ6_9ASTR|nr:hypothetical protein OSB04_007376 [Centaurea solstitialis]
MLEKTVCNDSKYLREYVHSGWSQGCNDVFNRVADKVSLDVAYDDLLLPNCLSTPSSQQFKPPLHAKAHLSVQMCLLLTPGIATRVLRIGSGLSYLHKPFGKQLVYQEENLEINIIPLISNLLKVDLPIWIYRWEVGRSRFGD